MIEQKKINTFTGYDYKNPNNWLLYFNHCHTSKYTCKFPKYFNMV